mmetsp:Transcript_18963/g.33524  ORF Transcript_18963/g.33524 Transcript_18963/m.33524 type:complete len:208 (+) Transcript_18963:265-888(+)
MAFLASYPHHLLPHTAYSTAYSEKTALQTCVGHGVCMSFSKKRANSSVQREPVMGCWPIFQEFQLRFHAGFGHIFRPHTKQVPQSAKVKTSLVCTFRGSHHPTSVPPLCPPFFGRFSAAMDTNIGNLWNRLHSLCLLLFCEAPHSIKAPLTATGDRFAGWLCIALCCTIKPQCIEWCSATFWNEGSRGCLKIWVGAVSRRRILQASS